MAIDPLVRSATERLATSIAEKSPVAVRLTVTDNRGADFSTLAVPVLMRAEISSPTRFAELNPAAIQVLGTAAGSDFISYTLEYAAGLQTQIETAPLNWIPFQESATPVAGGLLGTLNLPAAADGYFMLRLTVRFSSETIQKSVPLSIEGGVLPGWPIKIPAPPGVSGYLEAQHAVALARIGNEMRLFVPFQIVSGSISQRYVWLLQHRADASAVAGWPPPSTASRYTFSPVAVGNLDRDGNPEIAVTVRDLSLGQWWLHALRSDGTTLWTRAVSAAGYHSYTTRLDVTPTLEDLDGDGYLDVVVGGDASGSVQAFDRVGNTLPGFPIVIRDIYVDPTPPRNWPSGIATADLDGDGRKELAFIARTTDGVQHLYLYRSDGTPYPMAQGIVSVNPARAPVIGDINGDGQLDLVALTTSGVGAWRPDGTPLPGWPKTLPGASNSVALGDLNNDRIPEVIVTSTSFQYVYAFKGDGSLLPGWPVSYPAGGLTASSSDPLIADVNGDGMADVLLKQKQIYPDGVQILRIHAYGAAGKLLPGFPKQLSTPSLYPGYPTNGRGSPALEDFNQDGRLDLAVAHQGSNALSILFGNGLGGFSQPAVSLPVGAFQKSIAVGHLNDDTFLDLAVTTDANQVSVYLGRCRSNHSR